MTEGPQTDHKAFLIVGAGVIGTHHAGVIAQLAEEIDLVAVVDPDLDRAHELSARHGGKAFPSLADALDQVDVDVVVVCTPTGRHGEVAIQALDAGLDVILEKPAETTVERVDAIIEARQRSGRQVTVISQHRFDPSTEVVLAAIRRGEFGRLTSGQAAVDWWRGQDYYDSGGWRGTWTLDGGGALMNQGVHTVDLLLAAFGNPGEVFAYTSALAHDGLEVEDVAVALVRFEGGALATLHATTAACPGMSARLHVHGDRGSAVIDDDALTFLHISRAGSEGEQEPLNQAHSWPEASAPAAAAGSTPAQLSDSHRLQYLNFLDALRGRAELRVTLETNRRAIALIQAVYESSRTGAPVSLRRTQRPRAWPNG